MTAPAAVPVVERRMVTKTGNRDRVRSFQVLSNGFAGLVRDVCKVLLPRLHEGMLFPNSALQVAEGAGQEPMPCNGHRYAQEANEGSNE